MMVPLRLSDTLHTNMDNERSITHGRPERTRLGADGRKLGVRVGKTSMTTGRDERAAKEGIDGRVEYKNGQPPADRRRTVPRGSPVARQARARGGLGGRRARRLAPVPGGVRTPGGRRAPPIGAAADRLARLLLHPPARALAGRQRRL